MTLYLETFSINFYTESYQQTCFWLRLGLKNRISVIFVIMPQTRYYIIQYIWLCPIIKVFWPNHLSTIEALKCKLKSREKTEKINVLHVLTDTITKHETNRSKFT